MKKLLFSLIQKILFLLPTEFAHHLALTLLKVTPKFFVPQCAPDPCTVFNLEFPNRIGLAAGLDKNADYIDALAKYNFGFIEVGTVTPKPQDGNPKPRLFRLTKNKAVINRMGFNNKGVDHLVMQLKKINYRGILGVNIGKNKTTPLENALDDYLFSFRRVYAYAHYITVNISSPNTPDLRKLQFGVHLKNLLLGLKAEQEVLTKETNRYVPLLIKISPDLESEEVKELGETLLDCKVDGVIVSNTTVRRENLLKENNIDEQGGLSGAPLKPYASQILKALSKVLENKIPIVGVGGIMTQDDINERIAAGASLVQVYTGFVFDAANLLENK